MPVNPIFLNNPAPRQTAPGVAEMLQNIVTGILQQKETQRQQDVMQNIFSGMAPQQAAPSVLPPQDATVTGMSGIPAPTSQPPVNRVLQRDSQRQALFSRVMASDLPAERKQTLLKAVDLRFPKIEAQTLTFTNTETGRKITVKEDDPKAAIYQSDPAYQEGTLPAKNFEIVKYRDSKGNIRQKRVSAEDFNTEVAKIESAGGSVDTTKAPKTQLEQLMSLRDQLPVGSKDRATAEAAIAKAVTSDEMTVEFDAATGAFSMKQGPGAGKGSDTIAKATRNKIESDLLNTTNAIARLNEVEQAAYTTTATGDLQPKTEFLTLPGRLNQAVTSLKDFAGMKLNDEEKAGLKEFSTLKRSTIANVNKTLNELSGAAVSTQEAIRLRSQLPDAGNGLFDGDGPTQFYTKLEGATKSMRLAKARLNYVLKNGFNVQRNRKGEAENFTDSTGKPISLESMDAVIDSRGEELFNQLMATGMPEAQAEAQAIQQVKIEFGL